MVILGFYPTTLLLREPHPQNSKVLGLHQESGALAGNVTPCPPRRDHLPMLDLRMRFPQI